MMVERVIEQEDVIRQVLSKDKNTCHVPTWQDKEVLNGVNNALSVLKNFTDVYLQKSMSQCQLLNQY